MEPVMFECQITNTLLKGSGVLMTGTIEVYQAHNGFKKRGGGTKS